MNDINMFFSELVSMAAVLMCASIVNLSFKIKT